MPEAESEELPTTRSAFQQFVYSETSASSPPLRGKRTLNPMEATLSSPPSNNPKATRQSKLTQYANRSAPVSTQQKKRKRASSAHATSSKYAHLPNRLTDTLLPGLICVFIGVNPGLKTASSGHAYAHPSNLFWKLLYSSGCTPRLCKPCEDRDLPRLYALGNTNIVSRATKDASELSKAEMDEGVAVLEEKTARWRPEAVCVVGKGIWESIWRVRHGRSIKKEEFRYGWQDDCERMGRVKAKEGQAGWGGAWVFVATTTSGLAAGMRPDEKEEIWKILGEWVAEKRKERVILETGVVGKSPELLKDEEYAKG